MKRPTRTAAGSRQPRRILRFEALERRALLAGAHFAIIGDYGDDNANELAVSEMVKSWSPELIVTTGDNNYSNGEAATIDQNIGKYYHDFIGNYQGTYGAGADVNRFFPSIGNHDWKTKVGGLPKPYLDYFTLPGNELYYDFVWGPVHFFMIDAATDNPDGATADSMQGDWLQTNMLASPSPWQIVVLHNAPYSSGRVHGNETRMQWPYKEWGADLVLAGHEHTYERLVVDGLTYVVNGLGGRSLYRFETPIVPGSISRYNANFGAMQAEVDDDSATFSLYSVDDGGQLVDQFTLTKSATSEHPLVPLHSTWMYLDGGSNQDTAWRTPEFDDSAWSSGPARLGYGLGGEGTVVSFGGDPDDRHIATYFRQTFQTADPLAYGQVALRLVRDDGAVVYLNGQQVFRSNMPAGAIGFDTLAAHATELGSNDAVYQIFVDRALLRAGNNVLAVEVHQEAADSTDLAFDLELVGIDTDAAAQVVGRHVFYNNSAFDGNDPAATAADDAAIATDKTALLPSQPAALTNYTSFNKGINGVMLDIAGLRGTLTAADFEFRLGNSSTPASWTAPSVAPSIFVRPGSGASGSDRVTLIWPDGALQKQWLQVTVQDSPATGLSSPDVFYFGNAVGEAGNSPTDAQVNAADELAARGNPRNIANPAPITFQYDYNRDQQVNAADQLISRGNPTNLASRLLLIAPTAAAGPAKAALANQAALAAADGVPLALKDAHAPAVKRRRPRRA